MKQKIKAFLSWLKAHWFHLIISLCACLVAISAMFSFVCELINYNNNKKITNDNTTAVLEIERPIQRAIPNVDPIVSVSPTAFVIPTSNNSGMPLSLAGDKRLYTIYNLRGGEIGHIKTSALSGSTFKLQLWMPAIYSTNYVDIASYSYASSIYTATNTKMLVFNDGIYLTKDTSGSSARPYLTFSNLDDAYSYNTKFVVPSSILTFDIAQQGDNSEFYRGRESVLNSPQAFGLYTKLQYDSLEADTIANVIANPRDYGLYNQGQYDSYGYSQYLEGVASANDYSFQSLFVSIMSAPYNIIQQGFNFEIFGLNLSGLVIFVLSIAILLWCLSIFKRK